MNKRLLLIAAGVFLAAQLIGVLKMNLTVEPYLPTLLTTTIWLANAVTGVLVAIVIVNACAEKRVKILEGWGSSRNLSFLAFILILVPELIKIAFYLAVSEDAIDPASPFLWGFDTLFSLLLCAQIVGAMILAILLGLKIRD